MTAKPANNKKFSFVRVLKMLGVAMLLMVGFYFWQPNRFDLISRKPAKPLPRVAIEKTGLLEPQARVMIVTAHPDDEAFYLGGTLIRLQKSGAESMICVLTNGDKGYYPFGIGVPKGLAQTRQREVLELARTVDVGSVFFFNGPDGRLRPNDAYVAAIAAKIRQFRPTHLLIFDSDFPPRMSHSDHRIAGEIGDLAAHQANFSGSLLRFSTQGSNTALDVSNVWTEAQALLAIHKSQFHDERLKLIEGMVTGNAVAAGEKYDMTYAELFRWEQWVEGNPASQ